MDGFPGVRNYGLVDPHDLYDVYCYAEDLNGDWGWEVLGPPVFKGAAGPVNAQDLPPALSEEVPATSFRLSLKGTVAGGVPGSMQGTWGLFLANLSQPCFRDQCSELANLGPPRSTVLVILRDP